MFDRFTDLARKALSLARQSADEFNHDYIGTEHILLGLIKMNAGVSAEIFQRRGIELSEVRLAVERIVKPGATPITIGQLPFTPRGKKVLEYAIDEAREMDHSYVCSEHLLLGLLREDEGLGAQVLMNFGFKAADVRSEVMKILGTDTNQNQVKKTKPPEPKRVNKIHLYAHKAMEIAVARAEAENREMVASDDILLALLSQPECLAAKLLLKHGLELDAVRAEALKMRVESPDSN